MLTTLKKLETLGKPYRIYTDVRSLESDAIDQFVQAMQLDCVVKGALMPDAYSGYTLPIGAVVAVKGMVFPSFVGYDIGCGMCALPTSYDAEEVQRKAKDIFNGIYRAVPVGFSHNSRPSAWPKADTLPRTKMMQPIFAKNGLLQLSSAGGGNHFSEIGVDETGRVWIIVHSGSRGIGHAAATHYMREASPDGKSREGYFGFSVDSRNGQDYITDLDFCLEFALENRRQIIQRIEAVLSDHCDGSGEWSGLINRNHNHAELKDGLWIHRKGATHAEEGMMGVIPGNMRDGSFIVRGKGNPDSLWSSSHGAGRVLSRKKAKQTLSVDSFAETMSGIVARITEATIDESPFAYKDIFDVMKQQSDLVEVVAHVRPILNVKG